MSGDDRDLAATHALGALPPDEAAARGGSGENAALASEVEEYRSVVETLESGMAREAPPVGLFDVVLSRIEAERARPASTCRQRRRRPDAATAEPTVARRRSLFRPGRRRVVVPFAAGFAVAVAVVAIAVAVSSGTDLGRRMRGRPCKARRSSRPFTVTRGCIRRAGRTASSSSTSPMCRRPRPARTTRYGCSARAPVGQWRRWGRLRPAGSKVRLELGLPGSGDYTAVDVSVEPDGGSASHSGQSLAGGRFEPLS